MRKGFETKNEIDANMFDLDLDRLARKAYERRETDERWRTASMKIDAARNAVRQMMHQKRREATE